MSPVTKAETATIQKQVLAQFNQLIADLNRKDARAWSDHYSKDAFLSVFALTDYFATRKAWVDTITSCFEEREIQQVDLHAVQITPLAPDLALLTSQEKTTMRLKSGPTGQSAHVFTMLWKKEPSGWKILHSHESWVDEPVK